MVENSTNEALLFIEFYRNLIENNNQKDLPFYLSNNIILDWFGKTIKTRKMVITYFREKIGKITHHLNENDVKFVENIAFRNTHEIKLTKESSIIIPSSPPFNNNNNNNSNNTTPPSTSLLKQTKPSTSYSNSIEIGQGDGVQNLLTSPYKRMKLSSDIDDDDDDDDDDDSNDDDDDNDANIDNIDNNDNLKKSIKYVTASGRIQFHRPSLKKFQTERKWERPIKLHIGYTSDNFKDFTIYLIIYEGNLKCRRNLLKDFCNTDKKQQLNDND